MGSYGYVVQVLADELDDEAGWLPAGQGRYGQLKMAMNYADYLGERNPKREYRVVTYLAPEPRGTRYVHYAVGPKQEFPS